MAIDNNNEIISIIDYTILDNRSVRFNFKILSDEFHDKNIKIKFIDQRFCMHLYTFENKFNKDLIYWAAPFLPYSDTLSFEAYHDNKVIYSKNIKLDKKEDLWILKKFPYLLNYHDTLIDISLVNEIFARDAYSSQLTQIRKSDVVVDIGSNVGAFVYYALKHKPSKIYCCEPNIDCINILKNHFDAYPHIFINQFAIADKTEDKELMMIGDIDNGLSGCNFISDNYKINWHDRNHKSQKTKGIDFIDFVKLNNIDFIDFLKVDCEGGEHYIFTEKNKHFICQNVHKIVVEYHGEFDSIIDFFVKNNFTYTIQNDKSKIGLIYARNNRFINI